MANKYKIGTRVLFVANPGAPIQSGEVKEYSPTGNYVGLLVNRGEQWVPVNQLGVQEVLSEPADAPVVAAAAGAETGAGTGE